MLPHTQIAASGDPNWLTKREAADRLKVTERTIERMIAARSLPASRLGSRIIRIRQNDVDALLTPVNASAVCDD